jgi:predicted enzyme related to lactoylglutathione lyase
MIQNLERTRRFYADALGLELAVIDTAAEALIARGVPVLTPVTEAPGGWSVEFKDPDGHPLAFFQAEALPRRL